jgi:hypothetical protein
MDSSGRVYWFTVSPSSGKQWMQVLSRVFTDLVLSSGFSLIFYLKLVLFRGNFEIAGRIKEMTQESETLEDETNPEYELYWFLCRIFSYLTKV